MTPLSPVSGQKDPHLLMGVWNDFQQPDFYWQVLILAFCLSLAWLMASRLRQRFQNVPDKMGLLQALRDQAFPLLSVLFLAIAKFAIHLREAQEIEAGKLTAYLFDAGIALLFSLAIVRAVHYMMQRSFPGAHWLGSVGRICSFLIWGWLALYMSGAAHEVIRFLETVGFSIGRQEVNLWMLLNGLVVVMLTLLSALWGASLIEARLMNDNKMDASLRIVLARLSKALFALFSILLSFSLIGIDITALSVFTGALGVGLGMGLQKIASNYVAGFIILLDRSIRLGDLIQLDTQVSGVVSRITTRYTVLKNLVDMEFIVPNESLVANIVQNQTYSNTRLKTSTRVSVAYNADLERAVAVLEEIALAHPRVLHTPSPSALVIEFADSAINLELGFWINDPLRGSASLRSEINMEIWRRFRQEGIEIPFPQREVRILGKVETAGHAKPPAP